MDNEKLNNEKELEAVEETAQAEEIVEEAESEEVSEAIEEAEVIDADAEDALEVDEDLEITEISDDEIAELEELEELDGATSKKGGKIAAIAGGVVAVILAVVAILWYFGIINPYETGYIDISGITLEELADQEGYTLKEYKKANGLPFLMPKSTNENAVRNNATLGATVAKSGMKFEDFKEFYGWDDSITEKSTVGKALGETKLSVIIGASEVDEAAAEEILVSFREFYGFGEEITLDTLYKDVRKTLDQKARDQRIEEEKAAAEAADEEKNDAEDKSEVEVESDTETEEKSDTEAE